MRRTQIYLTDGEWKTLSSISRDRRVPKSFLIREAVDQVYLARPSAEAFSKALHAVKGIWRNRRDIGDPVSYVRNLRRKDGGRERYLRKLWRKSSSTLT